MKKRIYRAVSVNRVSEKNILSRLNGRVVFGNDAAKDQWFGALMKPDGEVVQTLKWDVIDDADAVLGLLTRMQKSGIDVEVALEATGTYADALAGQYELRGFPVYRVSTKHTHDYAEIYDGVPSSHDAKSAAMVAQLHLHQGENSQRWKRPDEKRRDISAAADQLDWVKQDLLRYRNRLEGLCARYWPELRRIVNYDRAATVALIKEYGGPAEVLVDPEGARRLMRKESRGQLNPDKIEAVVQSARETLGLSMTPGEIEQLRRIGHKLSTLREELGKAEKRLDELAEENEVVCRVAEVVGKSTSAVLYAELGDMNDYESVRALQKAPGLNLKERSSGKLKGRLKITKRGSGTARRWLFMAVLRWIQKDSVAKAWYQRKIARDGGIKLKALIALMRKLMAGLYHVARGARFDSEKLFDTSLLDVSAC